jgi:mannose-1-phosphate guanylyltransferase
MSDTIDLAVVIMAGGAGTRFWPMSTEARPKQFLRLFGERSLLQQSYDRVAPLVPPERVLVLTNARFLPLVREQLPELPEENLIGEPMRRDTSAAIALAALLCARRFGNPVMAVLTADHLIEPPELFRRTLLSAASAAARSPGALYTFGIQPTYPATGYGYLQRGEPLGEDQGIPHYRLLRFREKPDAATAKGYLESGEFYWNSGLFAWTVEAILGELRRQLPGHLQALEPAAQAIVERSPRADEALAAAFQPLPVISIDYGVMEKAADVRCVASHFEWNDVGGWLALAPFLDGDSAGNAHRGGLRTHQARGNLVFCEDPDEVVALVGVEDLVVVRAGRCTLIVPRARAEETKKLVASLEPELR